jgi:hypothetical protein
VRSLEALDAWPLGQHLFAEEDVQAALLFAWAQALALGVTGHVLYVWGVGLLWEAGRGEGRAVRVTGVLVQLRLGWEGRPPLLVAWAQRLLDFV